MMAAKTDTTVAGKAVANRQGRLWSRLDALRREDRGVSAIEFAIVLPFMLALYIGGIELAEGLAIQIKVTSTAHAVADITTQNTSINNAAMSNILNASAQVIAPYASAPFPASSVIVTVSEVSTDASGNAKVTWSDSLNGTARAPGTSITLPSALAGKPNVSLILGEVSYNYTPNLGYTITGTVTLTDSYYLFPRNSVAITRVNS